VRSGWRESGRSGTKKTPGFIEEIEG